MGIPRLSVIIPVYNVEKYLERCVLSVLNQTIRDIEIIVVDDGSTDSSPELCDKLAVVDSRITVIHQENQGISGARNTGIKKALGDYIGFIDSDDWISEDFYSTLVNLAESNNACLVSGLYYRAVDYDNEARKGGSVSFQVLNSERSLEYYLKSSIKGGITHASCCTKIYKRSLIFDSYFEKGRRFEDFIYNFVILQKVNKAVFCDYKGYYYFCNVSSFTQKKFSNESMDLYYAAEYIDNNYCGNSERIIELIKQFKAKADFSIFIKVIKSRSNESDIKINAVKNCKLNYNLLMKSSLSLSRKIVLTIIKITPIFFFK